MGTVTLTERGVVLGRGRVPAGAARRCREAQPDGPGPLPRLRVRAQLARPVVSATRVTVTFLGRNVPSHPWRITLEP